MRVALVLLQASLAAATVLGPLQGLLGRVQGLKAGAGGGRRPKPSYGAPQSKPSYKPPRKPSYKPPRRPSLGGGLKPPRAKPSYRGPGGRRPSQQSRPRPRPSQGSGPSSSSYGNALAAPLSARPAPSSPSLSDEQMMALVLEMHGMMRVLMQNSQQPPKPQYSASGSNSIATPASSSNTFSSTASTSFPISSSSSSSFPTSSSTSTSSDSYGTPLGQPIISSNAPILPPPTPRPRPPTAQAASSGYGAALSAPLSFSTPQDPLVQAAAVLPQAEYQTELATLDAVIEMLAAYQTQQARLRREEALLPAAEERAAEETRERYRAVRFPGDTADHREMQAILAIFKNRRMDEVPEQDLSYSELQVMLQSADIQGEGLDSSYEDKAMMMNENKISADVDKVAKSDLRVERFF